MGGQDLQAECEAWEAGFAHGLELKDHDCLMGFLTMILSMSALLLFPDLLDSPLLSLLPLATPPFQLRARPQAPPVSQARSLQTSNADAHWALPTGPTNGTLNTTALMSLSLPPQTHLIGGTSESC